MGNKSSAPVKKRTGKLKDHEIDPPDRKEVVEEILETEGNYVEGLRLTIKTFEEPLAHSKKMKPKHMKTVFGNINTLYQLHCSFLEALQEASTGTECREIGSLLVDSAESFKEYTNYVNNCGDAQATLSKQQDKNPKLQTFLEEQRETLARKESLSSLLMLPLQRIPRYVLLATDLKETTPRKHPDYKPCLQALEKIKEVAEFVNNEKRIAENMQQLVEIEESIVGQSDIISRDREFVQEGDFVIPQKNAKPLDVHYFLFTDLFILVKTKTKSAIGTFTIAQTRRWKLLERELLAKLTIDDIQSTNFRVATSNGKIRFAFDSEDECQLWLSDFNEIRSKLPGFEQESAGTKTKQKRKKKKSKN